MRSVRYPQGGIRYFNPGKVPRFEIPRSWLRATCCTRVLVRSARPAGGAPHAGVAGRKVILSLERTYIVKKHSARNDIQPMARTSEATTTMARAGTLEFVQPSTSSTGYGSSRRDHGFRRRTNSSRGGPKSHRCCQNLYPSTSPKTSGSDLTSTVRTMSPIPGVVVVTVAVVRMP
jgi:hypothetical protein